MCLVCVLCVAYRTKFRQTKFRRIKFSAASQIFGSFVRRNFCPIRYFHIVWSPSTPLFHTLSLSLNKVFLIFSFYDIKRDNSNLEKGVFLKHPCLRGSGCCQMKLNKTHKHYKIILQEHRSSNLMMNMF